MNEKLCPLKYANETLTNWNCTKNQCQWWNDYKHECSIRTIARGERAL